LTRLFLLETSSSRYFSSQPAPAICSAVPILPTCLCFNGSFSG